MTINSSLFAFNVFCVDYRVFIKGLKREMNQPPGLLDRLSPRPMVCPLVRLGRSSPTPAQSSSHYPEHGYNYHSKYADAYEDRHFSMDRNYLEKEEPPYLHHQQQYYPPNSFMNSETTDYRANTNQSPMLHQNDMVSFHKQNSLDLSSLSLGTSYWEHENYNKTENSQSDSSPEYFRSVSQSHQTHETNYLLDNFTKLGKSSPSLDQGYHTLVSPSPGPISANIWNGGNVYKGTKYQNKNNSFDRLPDKLVIKIFSFLKSIDLSVCARVCRRFDILAWSPSLWRTIQLEGENVSGDRAIRGVLRQLCGQGRTGACPSVERVHLTDGAKLTDKGLMLLARRCPELTHLQIQGSAAVTNGALFEVATRCTNLQHLDVTGNFLLLLYS